LESYHIFYCSIHDVFFIAAGKTNTIALTGWTKAFWIALCQKQQAPAAGMRVALTARMLKGLHKSMDSQIELARDLEVDHALALMESGKAKFVSQEEMMLEARKRIG
jgi:hypothetical protein